MSDTGDSRTRHNYSGTVDTGSEVSAVSEQFYNASQEVFKRCPTLPLTGVTVKGATSGRAVKVARQFFAEINLKTIQEPATLLVVPKLSPDCIIGIDFLFFKHIYKGYRPP